MLKLIICNELLLYRGCNAKIHFLLKNQRFGEKLTFSNELTVRFCCKPVLSPMHSQLQRNETRIAPLIRIFRRRAAESH